MQLGWIEAAIRYAGRFAAPEKRAFQQVFDLSDPSVSRRQARFVEIMESTCGGEIFERNRGEDRLRSGALFLRDDVSTLPEKSVFDQVPSAERWLEDALGHQCYHAFEVTRASPDPAVLRTLVRAIQDKRAIGITYHSRRGQSQRSISPHFIVKVVGRMHVRGWDHVRNAARDFVITRIARTWPVEDVFVPSSSDQDWGIFKRIIMEELRGEDGMAREGIRRDFGLNSEGKRIFRVRKPIVPYLVDSTSDSLHHPVKIFEEPYLDE